jgi:hypothetical protein
MVRRRERPAEPVPAKLRFSPAGDGWWLDDVFVERDVLPLVRELAIPVSHPWFWGGCPLPVRRRLVRRARAQAGDEGRGC